MTLSAFPRPDLFETGSRRSLLPTRHPAADSPSTTAPDHLRAGRLSLLPTGSVWRVEYALNLMRFYEASF